MTNLFLAMTNMEIILLVAAIVLAVAFLAVFAMLMKLKNTLNDYKNSGSKTGKVKVIDGVRYTESDAIANGADVVVSLSKGDIILKRGEETLVTKGGEIIPGKYTVLAADDNGAPFNVRIGGYVREFTHNTPIVLDEGELICPVSHTIVLR